MKFDYKKFAPGLIRPVIPVTVSHEGKSLRYEVLLDSGADMNLMNAEIADELGLLPSRGRKGSVTGVTGQSETYYSHTVTLTLGGHERQVEVSFAEKVGRDGYGILGQKGFFDMFKVKFDYQKETVEVMPYEKQKL